MANRAQEAWGRAQKRRACGHRGLRVRNGCPVCKIALWTKGGILWEAETKRMQKAHDLKAQGKRLVNVVARDGRIIRREILPDGLSSAPARRRRRPKPESSDSV